MPIYKIVTLVDITRTEPSRTDPDKLKHAQQANFNSLLQTINLRANITWNHDPKRYEGTLPTPFEGRAAYWEWQFESEREDLFLENSNPVSLLQKDLHGVPVIDRLTNTVDLTPPIFDLFVVAPNTAVEII